MPDGTESVCRVVFDDWSDFYKQSLWRQQVCGQWHAEQLPHELPVGECGRWRQLPLPAAQKAPLAHTGTALKLDSESQPIEGPPPDTTPALLPSTACPIRRFA